MAVADELLTTHEGQGEQRASPEQQTSAPRLTVCQSLGMGGWRWLMMTEVPLLSAGGQSATLRCHQGLPLRRLQGRTFTGGCWPPPAFNFQMHPSSSCRHLHSRLN